MEHIEHLVDEYRSWLKAKTSLRQLNGTVEITTPFLDRHNDYIQIYVEEKNGGFLLHDDGYTLDDLELSGCSLDTPKRRTLLTQVLNGFGVQEVERHLQVKADRETFPVSKHNLIQAILSVGDMFFTASSVVHSLFVEDLEQWLDLSDIRCTPRITFLGKSGFSHHFDFAIPKSRRQPERIIRAMNNPGKDNAKLLAFAWTDTKQARPADSRAYAFLNDTERRIAPEVINALRSYEITPVAWSRREEVREELAA